MTLDRLSGFGQPLLLVVSHACRFLALNSLRKSGLDGRLLLEETPKNTSMAMVLAALADYQTDDVLLFTPADHLIPNHSSFQETIRNGWAAANDGFIVTLGIRPTSPDPAYGYIQCGLDRGDGTREVKGFIEKPNQDTALRLIMTEGTLWNAGVFLCRVDVLLAALSAQVPDLLELGKQAMSHAKKDKRWPFVRPDAEMLETARAISFDHAVMEHHKRTVVVPYEGQWSDVGSWHAFAQISPADDDGNRMDGRAVVFESSNTFVKADSRLVVALGTKDLVVIETADAVLVADVSQSQNVKLVVKELERKGFRETSFSSYVTRPWGGYEELDRGKDFRVKRLNVNPGCALSLQMHQHRAEYWVVVTGRAHVVRGQEEFALNTGESTYIECGQLHQLKNQTDGILQVLEVQTGNYLEEDDIVRFERDYFREGD